MDSKVNKRSDSGLPHIDDLATQLLGRVLIIDLFCDWEVFPLKRWSFLSAMTYILLHFLSISMLVK